MSEMPNECECCDTTLASLKAETPSRALIKFMGMWMCPTCYRKEQDLQEQSKLEAESRVVTSREATSNNVLEFARKQDQSVKVVTDIHNAYTVQIMELEAAISADETIPSDKKHTHLAAELQTRYAHLGKVMHDARQMVAEAGNQQRAIQTYMNDLAHKLREDEREKFKLTDISYSVENVVRKAKKASSQSGKQPKGTPSMKECKEAADKYKIDVATLRLRLTRKHGETVEQAAQAIAAKMKKFGLA